MKVKSIIIEGNVKDRDLSVLVEKALGKIEGEIKNVVQSVDFHVGGFGKVLLTVFFEQKEEPKKKETK